MEAQEVGLPSSSPLVGEASWQLSCRRGIILPPAGYLRVIRDLRERGAESVVLGCTEIPLLVSEADAGLPLFDTTTIHAEAALRYAIRE